MGAQPTVTAHNLLVKQGVLTTPKIAVKMPKAIIKPVEEPKAPVEAPIEAPTEEVPAAETETAA